MDIQGVEIFSAGEWNGDEYTIDDLQEMVKAFNENSVGARPHLKLGHDDKQELLQRDGYPAAGWVERLYIRGEKLVADFSGIPDKIYKLIQNKAYRKVSSEIFFNIKIGGKVYKRMLAAVALLGADNPGVMNLDDIMKLYKKIEGPFDRKVSFQKEFDYSDSNPKEINMNEQEKLVKLEFENKQKAEALAKVEAELEASKKADLEKEKELADLKEFKVKAEKEKLELIEAAQKAQIEKFTSELVTEKLATPAMKPLLAELLGADKKEYSLKVNDQDKKLSKEDLLKETLKLFKAASEVNFEENSEQGNEGAQNNKEEELISKAEEYAKEHKVSFGQAVKAIKKLEKEG